MMKFIEGMYFLNIGVFVSGVYLIALYIILGDATKAMDESMHVAFQGATMLWFRNRFNLKP